MNPGNQYVIRIQGKAKKDEFSDYTLNVWNSDEPIETQCIDESYQSGVLPSQVEMKVVKPAKNHPPKKETDNMMVSQDVSSQTEKLESESEDDSDRHYISILPVFRHPSSHDKLLNSYQYWISSTSVIVNGKSQMMTYPINTSDNPDFKYKSECRKLLKIHLSIGKNQIQTIRHLSTVSNIHQYICILKDLPTNLPNILSTPPNSELYCRRDFHITIPREVTPCELPNWYLQDNYTQQYQISDQIKSSVKTSLHAILVNS